MMASDDRAGGKSENPGKSRNGEVIIFPLVGIGFIDNSKWGGGECTPVPPALLLMHAFLDKVLRGQIGKLLLMKREIHNFELKFCKPWQNDWHLILDSSRIQCLWHLAKQTKIMHQRVRKNVKLKWHLGSSVYFYM